LGIGRINGVRDRGRRLRRDYQVAVRVGKNEKRESFDKGNGLVHPGRSQKEPSATYEVANAVQVSGELPLATASALATLSLSNNFSHALQANLPKRPSIPLHFFVNSGAVKKYGRNMP
jgi:hypothetical protein